VASSILNDVKKLLGMDATYTAFDTDVIIHINSVFNVLWDLGIGPTTGFMIMDDTATWDAFVGTDLNLNSVKSYVFLRVKRLFDPPTTSFAIESTDRLIQEAEWRLSVKREGESWTDPNPPPTYPQTEPPWWEIF
jgi:hypothetical protein